MAKSPIKAPPVVGKVKGTSLPSGKSGMKKGMGSGSKGKGVGMPKKGKC